MVFSFNDLQSVVRTPLRRTLLRPSNVRLAHVHCNNLDYGWRSRIRALLENQPDMSFEDIANALNRKKRVIPPPGASSWTAKLVRKAYVS